jgi:hypothetical protein
MFLSLVRELRMRGSEENKATSSGAYGVQSGTGSNIFRVIRSHQSLINHLIIQRCVKLFLKLKEEKKLSL